MNDPASVVKLSSWQPSQALIARIKRAYRGAMLRHDRPASSVIWDMIAIKQEDIHLALLSDDDCAFELLSNPAKTELYYGVDNLSQSIVSGLPDSSVSDGERLRGLIEILTEALGKRHVFNEYGGERYPNKTPPPSLSTEEYLDSIDEALGIRVAFPNPFEGEWGIHTARGCVSERAIAALHQAFLVAQVARFAGGTHCLEIGAGMGRTAFYARQLGLRYTIIDLPMTLVGQALFLSATLGENSVWMPGDEMSAEGRIELFPATELDALRARKFDVILNVDSLTEIGQRDAEMYMQYIKTNAKIFISINHEANIFTVNELASSISELLPLSRSNYWLRPGYVEELFVNKPDRLPIF